MGSRVRVLACGLVLAGTAIGTALAGGVAQTRQAILAPPTYALQPWQSETDNLVPARGTIALNGRPISGAYVRVDSYLLPKPTDANGHFTYLLDQTLLGRHVVTVTDAAGAKAAGQPLTDAERTALLASHAAITVAYALKDLKVSRDGAGHPGRHRPARRRARRHAAAGRAAHLPAHRHGDGLERQAGRRRAGQHPHRGPRLLDGLDRDRTRRGSTPRSSPPRPSRRGTRSRSRCASRRATTSTSSCPRSSSTSSGCRARGSTSSSRRAATRWRSRGRPRTRAPCTSGSSRASRRPTASCGRCRRRGSTPPAASRWCCRSGSPGRTVALWEARLNLFSRREATPGGPIDLVSWPTALPSDAPRQLVQIQLKG